MTFAVVGLRYLQLFRALGKRVELKGFVNFITQIPDCMSSPDTEGLYVAFSPHSDLRQMFQFRRSR